MRSYKLYGSGSAAGDNVQNVLIAKSGRIKSIRWEVSFDAVADNSVLGLELSSRSTSQISTHDSTGDFSQVRSYTNLVTSGIFMGRASKQELVDIPIAAGERLYLHAGLVTTLTYYAAVYVDIQEGA